VVVRVLLLLQRLGLLFKKKVLLLRVIDHCGGIFLLAICILDVFGILLVQIPDVIDILCDINIYIPLIDFFEVLSNFPKP
jgi:uncharacterized membrane protein